MEESRQDVGVCSQVSDNVGKNESSPDGSHDDDVVEMSMKELDEKGFAPIVANTMFKNPQEENENESKIALECGMSSFVVDVSKLPALPEPRYQCRRQETNVGISLVVTMTLGCIGMTHGISLVAIGGIAKHSTVWWAFFTAIYAETGIALILLSALLLSDPGVVRRSEENSFPIPLQCEGWIKAHVDGRIHESQPPQERYIASSDPDMIGDSYCVRCLVWRRLRESKSYFHCSICQRCVMHYDHHCSVFGRCIGGTSWRGNYKFFIGLIVCGGVGCLTSVTCLLWSVSLRYEPQIAVPIALILLWMTYGIVMGRNFTGTCTKCLHLAMACIDAIRQPFKI